MCCTADSLQGNPGIDILEKILLKICVVYKLTLISYCANIKFKQLMTY